MRAVSTPALRECIDVKLLCGDVMMEMFEQHMDEMRKKQMADMRKGSVVKVREASACVLHFHVLQIFHWSIDVLY